MRFSIRQLLLYVTALSVWFGVLAQAYDDVGWGGVFAFGFLFGLPIFAIVQSVPRWSGWRAMQRAVCIVAVSISLATAFSAATYVYANDIHRYHQFAREANRLNDKFLSDPRFSAVYVTHEPPPNRSRKRAWLWIHGTVADQESLDALREIVGNSERWSDVWEVRVVPRQP